MASFSFLCVFSFTSAYPEVLHNEMQYVDQLRYSMSLLHNDFASPVGQHLVAVLHACRDSWSKDGHGLPYNCPSFHGVGLQQAVKDLGEELRQHSFKKIFQIKYSIINANNLNLLLLSMLII